MKLKYLSLPKGIDFEEDQIAFLETIDGGFATMMEKNESLQDQVNKLYLSKAIDFKAPPDSADRKEAREWLVKFFKKDMTLKEGAPVFTNYMATDTDETGGYLVPELLANEIAHCVKESGIARRDMRYMPFSGAGNKRRLPKELNGVAVQWVDEGGLKPLTGLTLSRITHELKKLAAIAVITEELIEDTGVDLVAYVARRIGEAIAREEDRVYFTGDIVGDGDPFNGVINAAGVVYSNMAVGTGIDDLTADDLLKLIYAVPKEARSGAAFYMHSDVMFMLQSMRTSVLADGDGLGQYLVQQPTGDTPAKLWGYPIHTLDVLPSLDDDGVEVPFLIFANLQKTCVYGDKLGVRVKLLTEATLTDDEGATVNLAQSDMIGVRVHKRTGYAVLNPECIGVLKTGAAGGQ